MCPVRDEISKRGSSEGAALVVNTPYLRELKLVPAKAGYYF